MSAILSTVALAAFIPFLPTAQNTQPPANDSLRAVVKANTQFAVDLHQQLGRQQGNVCYSPWSISTVLEMTSAGADGRTLEQMTKTLHLPDQRRTHDGAEALLRQLKKPAGCELNAANALFVHKHIPWRKEFLDQTRQHYGSSIFAVDFVGKSEAARQSINTWVEGQTRKRIVNLIPPNALSAESTMVLVNAVYFKGQWDKPFNKRATEQLLFSRTPTDKIKTATMVQSGRFLYGENKEVQVLAMPYKGNELMMMLLLPRERNELAGLEKDLTGQHFQTWIEKLEPHPNVDIFLPRFKLTSEFTLKETLTAMGMGDAFTNGANFSKMSTTYELKISEVRHKAFVELQEEGTEAAAATAVEMTLAKSERPFGEPPPRVVFRADHPFLFSIVDRRSGSLLFVGRVSDPTR